MNFTRRSKAIVFGAIALATFFCGRPEESVQSIMIVCGFGAAFLSPMLWDDKETEFNTFDGLFVGTAHWVVSVGVSLFAVIFGAVPRLLIEEIFGPAWGIRFGW